MKCLVDILLLAAIIVFVVDLSGFTQTWKSWLGKWLGVQVGAVPPFDCSLCLTFWAGLIYLLATDNFTIPALAFLCMVAYCTTLIAEVLTALRELVSALVRYLWKLIDKLK